MPHDARAGRFNHISFELSAKIGFSPGRNDRPQRCAGRSNDREGGAHVIRGEQDRGRGAGRADHRDGVRHPRRRSDAAEHAGQERLSGRRRRDGRRAPTEAAKPAGPEPIGPLLATASAEAGKNDTQGLHRLPHLRQGPAQPHRPQSLWRRRRRHRARTAATTFLLRAQDRTAPARPGRPTCSTNGCSSRKLRARHQDDLRRRAQGQGARRHHRLSQLAERQSQAARERGAGSGAGGRRRPAARNRRRQAPQPPARPQAAPPAE